jgi:hypothetical protein
METNYSSQSTEIPYSEKLLQKEIKHPEYGVNPADLEIISRSIKPHLLSNWETIEGKVSLSRDECTD